MIISDDIHEAEEAYFVLAQFTFNDPADETTYAGAIGQNVALVRIENDDSEFTINNEATTVI